ncbi:MAG: HAMP domain-containing sensor histidine kinase [Devosia sp.]
MATGLVLASAFRQTIEARFDDTLGVYLSDLIGTLAAVDEKSLPDAMVDIQEPRFDQPFSGWYWVVIARTSGNVVLASDSLGGDRLMTPEGLLSLPPGRLERTSAVGPSGEELRLVARRVAFEDSQWYVVVVAASAETIDDDTARFATQLAIYLGLFAAILIAATFVQWRTSLRPLKQLGRELQAVQEGRAQHVSERLPSEIAPVAQALNALIDANQATLARARQHVGNLAHALKTPLSVLINDAANDTSQIAKSVTEQTQIMQSQVRYYLERAQMAAKDRMVGSVTDVVPALERLHRAMARLGERRGITVHFDNDGPVKFYGERQDFEEIVGNLVDNALKWAGRQVVIDLKAKDADNPRYLTISIGDDGPGLSEAQCGDVMSRGKRLDQSKPGSGLGLSIVFELVELYGGEFSLARSELGGLLAVVRLPRA